MSLHIHEIKELNDLYRQIALKNFEIECLHDKVRMFIDREKPVSGNDIAKAELQLRYGTRYINKSINYFNDFINSNTSTHFTIQVLV